MLYIGGGLKRMLDIKHYGALSAVSPFVARFVDRATGMDQICPVTRVHGMYFNLSLKLKWKPMCNDKQNGYISDLVRHLKEFKQFVCQTFDVHCKTELYTPKFHFLDHLVEDLEHLGS